MDIGTLLWAIFNGILLTGIGLIYTKFPPQKMNQFYGYRTRRSMVNKEVWDCANALGAKMILYLGLALLLLGVILYPFLIKETIVMTTIVALLIGLVIGLYWTETERNKRFDKNGNPKNTLPNLVIFAQI
jgi:uncharacterized membrane protein